VITFIPSLLEELDCYVSNQHFFTASGLLQDVRNFVQLAGDNHYVERNEMELVGIGSDSLNFILPKTINTALPNKVAYLLPTSISGLSLNSRITATTRYLTSYQRIAALFSCQLLSTHTFTILEIHIWPSYLAYHNLFCFALAPGLHTKGLSHCQHGCQDIQNWLCVWPESRTSCLCRLKYFTQFWLSG
jgi:hypothetical protein